MAVALQSSLLGDSEWGEALRARERYGALGTLPGGIVARLSESLR